MYKMLVLISVAIISVNVFAQKNAELIESCYTVTDSDLNGNQPMGLVAVNIYKYSAGYSADIIDNATKKFIVKSTAVELTPGSFRGNGGWRFSTPIEYGGNAKYSGERIVLEVYRTNKSDRNPTTVNAHLDYYGKRNKEGQLVLRLDRLQCKKINLQD